MECYDLAGKLKKTTGLVTLAGALYVGSQCEGQALMARTDNYVSPDSSTYQKGYSHLFFPAVCTLSMGLVCMIMMINDKGRSN